MRNAIRVMGLALVFVSATVFGQPVSNAKAISNLKEQALKMGQAFVAGNYTVFVHYNNPTIVRMMGGEAQMAATLSKMIGDMKAQGMTFKGISIGAPTKFYTSGTQLQCLLPQKTDIGLPKGGTVTSATLICISADGGKSWTFTDPSNKTMDQIHAMLPDLNKAIVVPPTPAPVPYN